MTEKNLIKNYIINKYIDKKTSTGRRSILMNSIILLNNHSSSFQLQLVFIATRLQLNGINKDSIYELVNSLSKVKNITENQIDKQLRELIGLKLLSQPNLHGDSQVLNEKKAYNLQRRFNNDFRHVINFKDSSISLDEKLFSEFLNGDDTNIKSFLCSIIVPFHSNNSVITYNKIKKDLGYSTKDIRNAKSLFKILSIQKIPAKYVEDNISNNDSVVTDGKIYSTKIDINMKKVNKNIYTDFSSLLNHSKRMEKVVRPAGRKMANSNILFGSDSYKKHLGKRSVNCNINAVSKKGKKDSYNSYSYFHKKLNK